MGGGGGGGTTRGRQPAPSLNAIDRHDASSRDEPSNPIRNTRVVRPYPVLTAYTPDAPTITELYERCQGIPGTDATVRTEPLTGSMLTSFAGCPVVETPYSMPLGDTPKSSTDKTVETGFNRTSPTTFRYVGLPGSMSIVKSRCTSRT